MLELFLWQNYEDVAIYVCKDYQGTKPAVCSRLLPSESLKMKQSADACYKTESFKNLVWATCTGHETDQEFADMQVFENSCKLQLLTWEWDF